MTDVRQILLDAMMSDRAPAAPGSNQAKVDELAQDINGRIVDHFLDVLKQARLKVVSDDCQPDSKGTCQVRDHYELRA